MTPDAPTLAGLEARLDEAKRRRTGLTDRAESLLLEKRAANVEQLTGPDAIRFRAMRRDIADAQEVEDQLAERVTEYRSELERVGTVPSVLQRAQRTMNSAGRLSPMHCPTEELRRLHTAAQRGEQAAYERRFTSADPLLPPELFPYPTAAIHDLRILNRLPGYAIEQPSVEYVRHISTTGAAAPTAEGELKPELTLVVDKLVAPAVKLAGSSGAFARDYRRLGRVFAVLDGSSCSSRHSGLMTTTISIGGTTIAYGARFYLVAGISLLVAVAIYPPT